MLCSNRPSGQCAHTDQRFRELSQRIADMTSRVERVPPLAQEAMSELSVATQQAIELFRAEGDQLRTRVERELQEYHAAQLKDLEKRFAKKAGPING